MISREIRQLMKSGSAIRRVWDQGAQMKLIHGAENVADMTLGNPFAPPPEALLRALEEVVARPSPDLHRYTASAGHPEVRERIAAHLDERGLLPGARGEHVVVTAGASAATNIALRSLPQRSAATEPKSFWPCSVSRDSSSRLSTPCPSCARYRASGNI